MDQQLRKRVVIIGSSVLGAVAVTAGAWYLIASIPPSADANIDSVAAFVASDKFLTMSMEEQKPFLDRMTNVWENENDRNALRELPENVRRDAMRNAFETAVDHRVQTYYALPVGAERTKFLDAQIDEMQARMRQAMQRMAQNGGEGFRGMMGGNRGAGGERPNAGSGENRPRPERTPDNIKARIESRDKARANQRAEFMIAVRERAEERGIQMPMMGRGMGGR